MGSSYPKRLQKLNVSKDFKGVRPMVDQFGGLALPMAVILGFVMVLLMLTSVLSARSNNNSSRTRQKAGASSIVSDSAIARILIELSRPENSSLLVRDYDPINTATGVNYLGADGIINSGDETSTGVDQWTGYNPSTLPCYQEQGLAAPHINLSGTFGAKGSFRILAYRYDPSSQEGTILVEGQYQNIRSHTMISVSIYPNLEEFPGIGLIKPELDSRAGVLGLRGRNILGDKGNVYFLSAASADPTITGRSLPDDPNRTSFLNAVWSSTNDGVSDNTIAGTLYACNLNINIPLQGGGNTLGVINSSQTLQGLGGAFPTTYQVAGIHLTGADVLTIDTTGGPVVLEMINPGAPGGDIISLRNTSKIINTRTDGQLPQVGDVRIKYDFDNPIALYDQTCIDNVFLHSNRDELRILTTGPGCPSGLGTNFEGVAWVEAILSSKTSTSNRNIEYFGQTGEVYDTTTTLGATSGIAVPDDVSSLLDLLQYTNWPMTYRYGDITNWQKVRL